MRIAGLRIAAPAARTLQELREEGGHVATAARIAEAIALRVTTEAPLTAADHEAILHVLGDRCPANLARLRRELLEEQRRLRRFSA
jgi:hypothetical protein